MEARANNTPENREEHKVSCEEEMVLQHSVDVIAGIGTDQDGRHRHNHQQSDSGF